MLSLSLSLSGRRTPGILSTEQIASTHLRKITSANLRVAKAAPIGFADRPNRGGSCYKGSDGAASGLPSQGLLDPDWPLEGPWDAVESCVGPDISRAPIQDSRATRPTPSSPVVPKQASNKVT